MLTIKNQVLKTPEKQNQVIKNKGFKSKGRRIEFRHIVKYLLFLYFVILKKNIYRH